MEEVEFKVREEGRNGKKRSDKDGEEKRVRGAGGQKKKIFFSQYMDIEEFEFNVREERRNGKMRSGKEGEEQRGREEEIDRRRKKGGSAQGQRDGWQMKVRKERSDGKWKG